MPDVKLKSPAGNGCTNSNATATSQPATKTPEKIQDGQLVDPFKKGAVSSTNRHEGILARWRSMLSGRNAPKPSQTQDSKPCQEPATSPAKIQDGQLVDPFKNQPKRRRR